MNGGEVILADEPTGALDSKSGADLMALLKELHAEGHTIIIVTHDARGRRSGASAIIEIKDGQIIGDTRAPTTPARRRTAPRRSRCGADRSNGSTAASEAFRMSIRAMLSHKLRTFLTMLGIIIGIASVVSVVALGQGTQQTVLENIASIGTNTINIYPGTGFGDRGQGRIRTLLPTDAEAIAAAALRRQRDAARLRPTRPMLFGNLAANAQVSGVGTGYFRVNGSTITMGSNFDETAVDDRAQVAVIDTNAVTALFKNGENPIGQVIQLGKVPVRVIGVVAPASTFGPGSSNPSIYIPYTTAMDRILGQQYLSQIIVRVADAADMETAQAQITDLLARLHGKEDFFLQNTNTIRETIQSTSQTLTLLISAIAVISLVVGGIGVMNIMLVSVSERTREIGIRMAVGARRGDILRQFLTEAVLVCVVGGAAGVALSLRARLRTDSNSCPAPGSPIRRLSIAAALMSSSLIGIVFGFMPARSAARLDPVQALARE